MKKIIVISDSFKGSLSSVDIATLYTTLLSKYHPETKLVSFPIADGGEGTVEAFSRMMDGEVIELEVHDSFMNPIIAKYFINKNNEAVIEVASCAALTQVGDKKDPSKTTTYGVGEQIKDAINRGVKKIYLGLGGSSTNDGGCGAAAALGVKFFNQNNEEFIPVGGTLKEIFKIDVSGSCLNDVEINVLSDVNNPMYGPNGAAHVYAKQKGADEQMIKELDKSLIHLSEVIKNDLEIDVSNAPGAGAAGAFGAGSIAFMNAKISSGIDSILKICHFEDELKDADYVFTGEGQVDYQTLKGKAIYGIASASKKHNVPVIVIAGSLAGDISSEKLSELGIQKAYAIGDGYSLEYSMGHAKELYEKKLIEILKDL